MQQLDEIEVECLPGNIPSTAEVDVEDLDFDTTMLVKDLDVSSIETITVLTDLEEVVCTLAAPSAYEEDEEDTDEKAKEPKLIGEEKED